MWALTVLLFAQTFGDLQSIVADGFTAQKMIVPLSAMCAVVLAPEKVLIPRHSLVLLAFVMSTTPSFLIGSGPEYLVAFISLAGYFLLANLVFNAIQTFDDFKWLLKTYLWGHAVVAVLCLLAILQIFDLGDYAGQPLAAELFHNGLRMFEGTENNPNASALHYVIGLPVCLSMIFNSHGWRRWPLAGLFLVMVLFLVLTLARAAMAGAAIGCGMVIYFSASETAKRRLLYMVAPIALVVLLAVSIYVAHSFTLAGDRGSVERGAGALLATKSRSTEIHGEVLHGAVDLLLGAPPWGIGYGNTEEAMQRLVGYYLNTHDVFLGIAVSYGLPSLFLYLAFCWLCMREALRTILAEPDRRRRACYAAVLGGIVGFLISALAHEDYVNSLFWTMLSLALASGKIAPATRMTLRWLPAAAEPAGAPGQEHRA